MDRNAISEVTRRNIFDELRLGKVNWSGRLGESDFLARVFDLEKLPSYDGRFPTMAGDIYMHREHFIDWDEDWIYDDSRLNLLRCSDETLLTFLCEMIHPVVRLDTEEAAQLAVLFNRHLAADGFEVAPRAYISGRPIYAGRPRFQDIGQATAPAKKVADELASDHIAAQITRMEASIESDPALAIGSAKEFVESVCKGILAARGVPPTGAETLQQLVRLTREALGLTAAPQVEETLRKTVNALATITQGITELRGQLGSGHGHHPAAPRPRPEVARLAVGAAVTLGVFLYEVHRGGEAAVPAGDDAPAGITMA
jgi:AbiJ N-terminal domain 3/Abortive infection C-terminus